jgi:hypothetical protein
LQPLQRNVDAEQHPRASNAGRAVYHRRAWRGNVAVLPRWRWRWRWRGISCNENIHNDDKQKHEQFQN